MAVTAAPLGTDGSGLKLGARNVRSAAPETIPKARTTPSECPAKKDLVEMQATAVVATGLGLEGVSTRGRAGLLAAAGLGETPVVWIVLNSLH